MGIESPHLLSIYSIPKYRGIDIANPPSWGGGRQLSLPQDLQTNILWDGDRIGLDHEKLFRQEIPNNVGEWEDHV